MVDRSSPDPAVYVVLSFAVVIVIVSVFASVVIDAPPAPTNVRVSSLWSAAISVCPLTEIVLKK